MSQDAVRSAVRTKPGGTAMFLHVTISSTRRTQIIEAALSKHLIPTQPTKLLAMKHKNNGTAQM